MFCMFLFNFVNCVFLLLCYIFLLCFVFLLLFMLCSDILFHCVVLYIVLLPPDINRVAVNRYVISFQHTFVSVIIFLGTQNVVRI